MNKQINKTLSNKLNNKKLFNSKALLQFKKYLSMSKKEFRKANKYKKITIKITFKIKI